MLTKAHVQEWLDSYIAAWREYDRQSIESLFSEDATYAYHPHDEPLKGREAIVASWLDNQDAPGSWEAAYAPFLIDGNTAISTGESRYTNGDVYSNLFVMRFNDEGRCVKFVEWFAKHQPSAHDPSKS